MAPRISVVMAAYNAEDTIASAVQSILDQTFGDFEFIIIDDGSRDRTVEIIQSFDDARIVLRPNDTNMGLSRSLNRGLSLAHGAFVARMDADDVAVPTRFETQLGAMDADPSLIVVGSAVEIFYGEADAAVVETMPESDADIRYTALFVCPMVHPTTLIRRSDAVAEHLHYDTRPNFPEDYDLWLRLLPVGRFRNIGRVLLRYRRHATSITQTSQSAFGDQHKVLSAATFQRLGILDDRESALLDIALDESRNWRPRERMTMEHVRLFRKVIWCDRASTGDVPPIGRFARARCRAASFLLISPFYRAGVSVLLVNLLKCALRCPDLTLLALVYVARERDRLFLGRRKHFDLARQTANTSPQ